MTALLAGAAFATPSLAWDYAVTTDDAGLAYAKLSGGDTSGNATIYTECTEKLGLGLALILKASDTMIAQYGGQSGQILYMNDGEDSALATVDYAPGEGILTLATPDREVIEQAWKVFATASEKVSVRFALPPFPQIYEVVFPVEGLADAMAELDAYCR